MKKIAIVYDKENWKTTTKLAVDEIRKDGVSVVKRKEEAIGTMEDSDYLCNHPDFSGFEYTVENSFDLVTQGFVILTMPQDMPKLKEFLGIEVPKDGEVYAIGTRPNNPMIIRIKNAPIIGNGNPNHSGLAMDGSFNKVSYGYWKDSILRKATPEETTKLIEAEHANRHHWDGSSLVKIPEYVEVTKMTTGQHKWYYSHIGEIFPIKGISEHYAGDSWHYCVSNRSGGISVSNCKPSTREAYEIQEFKKTVAPIAKACGVTDQELDAVARDMQDIPYKSNKEFEKQMEAVKKITLEEAKKKTGLTFNEMIERFGHEYVANTIKGIDLISKKPTKRIILSQYESIEILVDEFEMVHGNGKILLLPK